MKRHKGVGNMTQQKRLGTLSFVFVLVFSLFILKPASALAGNQVLIYVGYGTTSGSAAGLEKAITGAGYTYTAVTAPQMNAMTRAQFDAYKLIVIPGGNSINIGTSLTKTTTNNVHNAVTLDGVSYFGVCAGAFMAETSSLYNTFKLAPSYFNFYDQNAIKWVEVTFPGKPNLDMAYWNGPELNGFGSVVAKYGSNGQAAIAEGKVGAGWVIISAVHPEATSSWGISGTDGDDIAADNAYAITLVKAAFNKTSLAHY
jgi:glutamine amidotransferase-like uncharacterized protein